ncbi:metal ABC transporter permease [Halocola ammonii]
MIWEMFFEFLSFSDPNVRLVTFGTIFLGMASAVVGSFAFLRKRALVGDAIAHSILPGVALAFVFTGSKNPYYLLLGALLSGWVSIYLIELIVDRSKIKADTAIAIVLSVFFGVGIFLLTIIQHSGAGNQSGLDQFLFGQAASMRARDVWAYVIVGAVLLVVTIMFFKSFKLLSFNPDFAATSGLPVRFLRFMLNTLTVLAIAVGIQSVGVVLMAALLITPSAVARSWTNRLSTMILLAAFVGAVSGLFGSFVSYASPSMPTGPWIVVVLSVLALLSLVFAPETGIVARWHRQRKNRKKVLRENLLKAFYHIGERAGEFSKLVALSDLQDTRDFISQELSSGLRQLEKRYLIIPDGDRWKLSEEGLRQGKRVVRLHRIWEMYLTERMRLKEDHIHPNAETIEHIITPDIEEQLLEELGYPEVDPHESEIPYEKIKLRN